MAKIKSSSAKIYPCLWFDKNADKAVDYYLAVFRNTRKGKTTYYGEGSFMPAGTLLTAEFFLEGQKFLALNGGPVFKFTEAVSFVLNCKDQDEIDYYWEKLSKGGQKMQCGWLKDKFGLAWQIVPENIGELMAGKDPEKTARVMQALFKMKKISLPKLLKAREGK